MKDMKMDRRHVLAAMGALLASPALAQVQEQRPEPTEPGGGTLPSNNTPTVSGPPEWENFFKFLLFVFAAIFGALAAMGAAYGGWALKLSSAVAAGTATSSTFFAIGGAFAAFGGATAMAAKIAFDAANDPPRKDWERPVAPIEWATIEPVAGAPTSSEMENLLTLTQSMLDLSAVMVTFLEAREKATGALKAGDAQYSASLEAVLAELRPQVLWHLEDVLAGTNTFARDLAYWFELLRPEGVCTDEHVFPEAEEAYTKMLDSIDLYYDSNLLVASYEDTMNRANQQPFALLLRNVEQANADVQRLAPPLLSELSRKV